MGGDICAPCCGAEREVTVRCPLDCAYLQEAHRHERPPEIDPEQVPNRDIEITEQFLNDHRGLLNFTALSLLEAALPLPGAVDSDVREALDALIRTYRTRQSGLYYETRPANLLASAIHQRLEQSFQQYRQQQRQRAGVTVLRDAEFLGVLVFLQRLALTRASGRRLSRSFLGVLRDSMADAGLTLGPEGWRRRDQSPLILP